MFINGKVYTKVFLQGMSKPCLTQKYLQNTNVFIKHFSYICIHKKNLLESYLYWLASWSEQIPWLMSVPEAIDDDTLTTGQDSADW